METEHTRLIRLTRAQVREVDRIAIEEYGLPGIVLMENAARGVVEVAEKILRGRGNVVILCGGGNNGGDGFAVARHLANRGYEVLIVLAADAAKLRGDALINFRVIEAMKLPIIQAESFSKSTQEPDLVIDALFGTGITRAIEGQSARLIGWVNEMRSRDVSVLAVDLPSGLDADTGKPTGPCVRATHTVTFVAEKAGFASSEAKTWLGEVSVADIGAPIEIVRRVQDCA